MLLSNALWPNAVFDAMFPPPRLVIKPVDTSNGISFPLPSDKAFKVPVNGKLSLSFISEGYVF